MISFYNPNGKICISERYFAELIGGATKNAVGMAGLAESGAKECIKAFLSSEKLQSGVCVTEENGTLWIDLHIKVVYGVNISQTVKSIQQNVSYTVENATGFTVLRINVSGYGWWRKTVCTNC